MAGAYDLPASTPASLVDGRPNANLATSPAKLVAAMRELKRWSGLSYRQLEARAAKYGAVLPRSTLMNALNRESLPRESLVVAFARACGCGDGETAGWVAARRRLAMAAADGMPAQPARSEQPASHGRRLLAAAVIALVVAALLATTTLIVRLTIA